MDVILQQAYSAQGKLTIILQQLSMLSQIEIANGNSLKVEGSGYVQLNNCHGSSIKLKALHVPKIIQPLISLGKLFCKGCTVQKADLSDSKFSKSFVVDLLRISTCCLLTSSSINY
ncbi:hypothetical protein VP01_1587g1 [Puccinia sorghi]|uniref:Retrovirus-related Pol polyprotein from transposon TNT 1-94-like beta-barrel domain-containing protein n=1 Tax=Puccinia sorghi TaxID=27349 RepID=A0A0L6VI51_9BASI|nr:hypothetical protein VP01_1587g1 [Puccinia sorghi]